MNLELFTLLKKETDWYLNQLHDLKGLQLDCSIAFQSHLKEFRRSQALSSKQSRIPISKLDEAGIIYSNGAPNDPNALIFHESTQGQLKARLSPNGLNEILIVQFCTIMTYEYWEHLRGKLAQILQVKRNDISIDIFGELRRLRHDIVHNKGYSTKDHSSKNNILDWFTEGDKIEIHEKNYELLIEKIFISINDFIESKTSIKPYTEFSLCQHGKARQIRAIKAGKMNIVKP